MQLRTDAAASADAVPARSGMRAASFFCRCVLSSEFDLDMPSVRACQVPGRTVYLVVSAQGGGGYKSSPGEAVLSSSQVAEQ